MNQNRCQEPFSETWQQIPNWLASFARPKPFQFTGTIRKYPRISEESKTMAPLTISLSDEEMRRLEALGKCEG